MKALSKPKPHNKDIFLPLVIQFFKFGLVGVSNTLIALAVYYLLIFLNVNYIISNTAAFIISVFNAYYWNHKYVFNKENHKGVQHKKALPRVFIAYGITFLLNTGLLILWVDGLYISKYIAPIINLTFTVPVNFLLNKHWAFR